MRKVIVLLVVMVVGLVSFKPANEWSLYTTENGVEIYSKVIQVVQGNKSKQIMVFKYMNTNDFDVNIRWRLDLYYGGVCRACSLPSPNEYEMQLNLNKKETKEGNASSTSKIFAVFYASKEANIAPFDRFEFSSLKVTKK
jgi:hypothetical protein